jgi:exodeoxyribonuclease-5
VIHAALRSLWQELRDQATLRARQYELDDLVRAAIAAAIGRARAEAVQPLPDALWNIEARRCLRLIRRLLARELERPEFTVIALERSCQWQADGVGLRLQIDRLDRLADGTHALFDYKTGSARSFDPLAARPEAPQLLAYSSALAEPLSALASVHLNVEGICWRGTADQADRLPGIAAAPVPEWNALRNCWQQQMSGLLAAFAAGDARLDPLADACARCHLSGLCRIGRRDDADSSAAEAAG